MFYNLRDKIRRTNFDLRCASVHKLAPITVQDRGNVAVLSLLQSKDLTMYLLALRSFMERVPVASIFVVNDGSLTSWDLATLTGAIPAVQFLHARDFSSEGCPSGGCWERLLAIAQLVKDHYVVQLDGDTLTINEIDEVTECIRNGTAFTLGTAPAQDVESMALRSAIAHQQSRCNPHVQLLAESNLTKLAGSARMKYVRGCAGFAGFPRGSFEKSFVEGISKELGSLIGSRWHEWGTEQVMSNILVANMEKTVVLPYPKYCSVDVMDRSTTFVHFIGSCRFNKGIYRRLAQDLIRKKQASERMRSL